MLAAMTMRPIAAAPAAVLAVALLALAACGDDGRQLRPPAPGATSPAPPISTTPPTVTAPPAEGATIALTSPTFAEGTAIPSRYSCSGGNVSPPLAWAGVPAGAAELAVVVVDLDAGGFVHWVVVGLDPTLTGLPEGARPDGAIEARNDSSEFGWFGPCPSDGDAPHRYAFTLYALGTPAALAPGVSGVEAIAAIDAAAIARGTIIGTFAPAGPTG